MTGWVAGPSISLRANGYGGALGREIPAFDGNDAFSGRPFDFPQDERTVGPGARDSRLRGNDWLEAGMAVDVAEPR